MRIVAVAVLVTAGWVSGCGVSQACLSWRDCGEAMACSNYQCVPRSRDDGTGSIGTGFQGSLGGISVSGTEQARSTAERWDDGGDVLYGRIGPMLFDPPLRPTAITRFPRPVGDEVQIDFDEARARGFIRLVTGGMTFNDVSSASGTESAQTIACYMPPSGTFVDTPTPESTVTALPDGRVDVRATDGTWAGRFRPPAPADPAGP